MQLRGSALAGRCIMALPDKVKAAWDALAIQMAEDMKRDDLSWSKEWSFDTPPVSVETGKPYRGRNAVLCLYAMRVNHLDDPRFMTYNAAKRAGFSVRRGEKAVAVIERWKRFAFLRSDPERRIRQPKNEEEWKEALKDPDIAVRPACVGYFNLFSATQIDGIEPFELPNRDIPPLDEFALDVLKGISPCPVNETYNDRAFYSPSEDGITVPLRSQFSSPEAFARTILHEMGHSTGHPSRLGRDLDGRFGSKKYAQEELVAELASVFSANALGFDASVVDNGALAASGYWENHAAYLRSWSEGLDNPGEALRAACGKAAAASEFILGPLESIGLERWRDPEAYGLDGPLLHAPSPAALAEAARAAAGATRIGDARRGPLAL